MGLSSKLVISSDGLDWNQTLLQAQTLELPKPPFIRRNQQQSSEPPLKCPRCDSTNTKFCYYNNYNKSQPRHFCKTCKRHWTKGGTLRNVPVGGGRKNKRLKTSKNNSKAAAAAAAATTTATTTTTRITTSSIINRVNPHMVIEAQQQKLNQNFPRALGEQKSVPEIMRQAIISPPSSSVLQQNSISNSNNGVFLGSLPQNEGLQFPYSSSSSCFVTNPSSISTSFKSSNIYDYGGDQAMEDSTITTILPNTMSSSITHNQLWQEPNTSYWNWDEMDNFVSTDLNMPWDDSELKPALG